MEKLQLCRIQPLSGGNAITPHTSISSDSFCAGKTTKWTDWQSATTRTNIFMRPGCDFCPHLHMKFFVYDKLPCVLHQGTLSMASIVKTEVMARGVTLKCKCCRSLQTSTAPAKRLVGTCLRGDTARHLIFLENFDSSGPSKDVHREVGGGGTASDRKCVFHQEALSGSGINLDPCSSL